MITQNRIKTVLTLAVVLGIFATFGGSLQAAQIIYEPFDYAPGSLGGASGGTGFSGAWATTSNGTNTLFTVQAGGLSFNALDVAGNSVYRTGSAGRAEANRTISAASQAALLADGTTIWFSVLYTAANRSAFLIATDTYAVGSTGTLTLAAAGEGFGFGTNNTSIIQTLAYDNSTTAILVDTGVDASTVKLIAGKITWAASGSNDTLTLYEVTDLTSEPTTPIATVTADLDQSFFDLVVLQHNYNTATFDEIRIGTSYNDVVGRSDPMDPSPGNGDKVLPDGALTLSWTNLDPNNVPPTPVWVDVWFGTDPEALALVVDADVDGQDANSVDVDASAVGLYYWRVDSYLGGSPSGDPNVGTLWTFSTDFPPTSVEILTPDMITWSGQGVDLEGTFVDDSDPLDWTIAWTSDPDAGVVFLPNANDLTPTVEITAPHRVVRGIQVDNDDAEEYLNSETYNGGYGPGSGYAQGELDLTSSDLEVGDDGEGGKFWQVCAVQYAELGIPQGATIISAKLTFQVDEAGDPYTSNDFTILAEATDDAAVFSTEPNNITDRARSVASVGWNPPTAAGVGEKVDTPDITALIQEVVDRAGWSDNNRLTLMIYPDVYLALPDPSTGGPTLVSSNTYEAGPGSDSATLTVEYESTDSSDPVTVTLTFGVNDVINPEVVTDTMTIDVYDTACKAAIAVGVVDPADFDMNCIVDLADLLTFLDLYLTCTMPNISGSGCVETYRP